MNKIIIFGSARSFGNTRKAVNEILNNTMIDLVDLNNLNISPFDYEHKNKNDDFIPLMENVITYDTIIIATPVYWYSTDANIKIFLDRISDLLKIRKDLGRKLRNKKLFVISSFQTSYPRGFEDMFEQICDYLGMIYLGTSFIYSGTENSDFLQNNIHETQKARLILDIKD